MGLYSDPEKDKNWTPKRQISWSNSRYIWSFDRGQLKRPRGKHGSVKKSNKTSHRYQDASGRMRWTGTKLLKATENLARTHSCACTVCLTNLHERSLHQPMRNYPPAFGRRVAELMPKLLQSRRGVPDPVPRGQTAIEIFRAMAFTDLVEDGHLLEVARYLRGSNRLRIPPQWREVLPTEL